MRKKEEVKTEAEFSDLGLTPHIKVNSRWVKYVNSLFPAIAVWRKPPSTST